MEINDLRRGRRKSNTKGTKITKHGMKTQLKLVSQHVPQAAHNFFNRYRVI
jgi:hypothetical protein